MIKKNRVVKKTYDKKKNRVVKKHMIKKAGPGFFHPIGIKNGQSSLAKRFFGQKVFLAKNIFSPKKSFLAKLFLAKNIFFDKNPFWGKDICWPKINVVPQRELFFAKEYVWPK